MTRQQHTAEPLDTLSAAEATLAMAQGRFAATGPQYAYERCKETLEIVRSALAKLRGET